MQIEGFIVGLLCVAVPGLALVWLHHWRQCCAIRKERAKRGLFEEPGSFAAIDEEAAQHAANLKELRELERSARRQANPRNYR